MKMSGIMFAILFCFSFLGVIIRIGSKYTGKQSFTKEQLRITNKFIYKNSTNSDASEYIKLFGESKSYPNYLNYKNR